MTARILILAGNYKQARACANLKGLGPTEWLFPLEPGDIAKYGIGEVVLTGTYEQREHAVDFLRAAAEARDRRENGNGT